MRKTSLSLMLFLLNCCVPGILPAQQADALNRLNTFVENIQVFNQLYHQEKVYLHFDNTGYFLGESIWFKAYVTAASDLIATPMSRVLYVELLDTEGTVQHTQKLRITNGQADGFIPLTRMAMKSGFYEVRAYTRLMLNWDTDHLFSRVFPVFEVPLREGDYEKKEIRLRPLAYKIPQPRKEAPSQKKLNLTFYPEGGPLVENLASTVAFQATDKDGRPVQVEGCIVNHAGDTLSVFSSIHEGRGLFTYTPEGDRNKLFIRALDENKGSSYTLPPVEQAGCVVQVHSFHPEQVRVAVNATPEFASVPLGMTVMCRGKLYYFKAFESIPENGQVLIIPRKELPAGVNQITLFTTEGKILSERLVYIHGTNNALRLDVQKDKDSYDAFDVVRMDISVQDASGSPVQTTLSLAVRDDQSEIPTSYEETIHTNLLLSSDLKGYISNPGYYFETDDRAHRLALDLLMLTQGYRRYSWSQMAGVTPFEPLHKIEKGIVIDGSVKTITRKKVQENIDVKMYLYSDSTHQEADCRTDKEGNFNYLADDFFGPSTLQINTKKEDKRKEYWITLDRLFSPDPRPYTFYDTYIPAMKTSKDKRRFMVERNALTEEEDSLSDEETDAGLPEGTKTLKEVLVKGRRARNAFVGRNVNIVYDVPEEEQKLEDKAAGYNEMVIEFLQRINPYFNYDDMVGPRYKGRKVYFQLDYGTGTQNTLFDENLGIASQDGYIAETALLGGKAVDIDADPDAEADADAEEGRGMDDNILDQVGRYSSSDLSAIAIIEEPSAYLAVLPKLALTKEVREGQMVVLIVLRLDPKRRKSPSGVRVTSLQGFSRPRTFYSPDYNAYQLPKEEDFRRTLYWNPNVKTNTNGKAHVQFFNNGTCREMNISAETITAEGIAGSYGKP